MKPTNVVRNSLEEVHETIDTTIHTGTLKKIFAFFGPAYLVSVGYMDPGNWATDIAGGSQFGYRLIWVLLMSNIMAILLQSLSARLGIVRMRDLAQASKESYPPFINIVLYALAEIAIAACDMAEVLGMAIGLQLLFKIPLIWGVCLTLLDTFLLLFLINRGMRLMEAFILGLVVIIGAAFLMEMIFARPAIGELAEGLIPGLPNNESLYIAIGIIGATVMPHNLYLHSSLVQSRLFEKTIPKIKEAIKYNFIDSAIALNLAFFVNAAILILAAATFYKSGMFEVSEIKDAHRFLQPLLGTVWAPMLFAIALIASGQSSTLTGTLAGQIIMEGYLNLRIKQWIRRIITRLLAIIPAVLTIVILGEGSVGRLLILSQVILSLQLGFAVIPLIHFVSDKAKMGEFAIGLTTRIFAWIIAGIIVLLNVKLVINQLSSWLLLSHHKTLILITIVPGAIGLGILLLFITVRPTVRRFLSKAIRSPHKSIDLGDILTKTSYQRVAIAIDFSKVDTEVLRHAISLCQPQSKILIVHIVETAGAIIMGNEINDFETQQDQEILEKYKTYIERQGFETEIRLGFGNPQKVIPKKVIEFKADILVMGAHGHKGLKDIIFGTTVDKVRHRVNVPVFIVKDNRVKT